MRSRRREKEKARSRENVSKQSKASPRAEASASGEQVLLTLMTWLRLSLRRGMPEARMTQGTIGYWIRQDATDLLRNEPGMALLWISPAKKQLTPHK